MLGNLHVKVPWVIVIGSQVQKPQDKNILVSSAHAWLVWSHQNAFGPGTKQVGDASERKSEKLEIAFLSKLIPLLLISGKEAW